MPKRLKQLDVLRAIAILLVLGCHVTWHPFLLRCGWTGVDLFFVLSGFLIAGLLFREYKLHKRLNIPRFLLRRGLKIYPAYYVFLIATVIVRGWWGSPVSWGRIWPDLFFVQNYVLGSWEHLWSLAAEEQFYLLLPCALALALALHKPLKHLPVVMLSIMALAFLARLGAVLLHVSSGWFPGCIRGMDGLALGVMIAYFYEFEPRKLDWVYQERLPLLVISLLCLLPTVAFPFDHPYIQTWGLSLLNIGYAGILVFFMKCVDGQGVLINTLAFIGSYSYTIYLFHMPVTHWFSGTPHLSRNVAFVLYLVCSIGLGIVAAKVVERPVLRIRERLVPSRS